MCPAPSRLNCLSGGKNYERYMGEEEEEEEGLTEQTKATRRENSFVKEGEGVFLLPPPPPPLFSLGCFIEELLPGNNWAVPHVCVRTIKYSRLSQLEGATHTLHCTESFTVVRNLEVLNSVESFCFMGCHHVTKIDCTYCCTYVGTPGNLTFSAFSSLFQVRVFLAASKVSN